jgi:pSer/pThr/pTyr-binding forkhead associated (FHA) protein
MSTGSGQLRLEVISGNATGSTIVVEDELVIGRHATGAGRLDADEEISRQHARISREATGDYAIEDLGSSNGTFVNGLRIQSPRLLEVGDSIEAGATTLVVREIVQPQPADAGRTVLSAAPAEAANLTVLAPVPTPSTPDQGLPLALSLEIDFDAREARIALGDSGEMVRMVFEDGRWRTAPGDA